MLLQLPIFPSLLPSALHPPSNLHAPPLNSCSWVVHLSFLASPFPILFLTSPVHFLPTIYATYSLYLFPHSLLPFPSDNLPCDFHFCYSFPVLVVCLVCFCFWGFCCCCFVLGSVVDICEFVVISLFMFWIFFFLDKSL